MTITSGKTNNKNIVITNLKKDINKFINSERCNFKLSGFNGKMNLFESNTRLIINLSSKSTPDSLLPFINLYFSPNESKLYSFVEYTEISTIERYASFFNDLLLDNFGHGCESRVS